MESQPKNIIFSLKMMMKSGLEFIFLEIINRSYMTDSYIVFTLKMESQPKNIIFGLKMMVNSGLEKFILNSLHAGR